MKYERTIKTLEKAGFTVEREIRESVREDSFGEKYEAGFHARKGESQYFIKAWKQEDSAICLSVNNDKDPSDSMTDYFPQIWCDSVKQAIAYAS